jgi:Resolvase, N terminal domain
MRDCSITLRPTFVEPIVIRVESQIVGGSFVSYLRVSTDKQGRSGLGIEAQRAAVASYLAGFSAAPLAEFVEVESGKREDRPELARALAECRVRKAPGGVVDLRILVIRALARPTSRFAGPLSNGRSSLH